MDIFYHILYLSRRDDTIRVNQVKLTCNKDVGPPEKLLDRRTTLRGIATQSWQWVRHIDKFPRMVNFLAKSSTPSGGACSYVRHGHTRTNETTLNSGTALVRNLGEEHKHSAGIMTLRSKF